MIFSGKFGTFGIVRMLDIIVECNLNHHQLIIFDLYIILKQNQTHFITKGENKHTRK